MEEMPLVSPRPQHSRLRMVLIAVIVVALAISAYVLVVLKNQLPGEFGLFLSAVTLPSELKTAYLVSSSPRGTDLYRHADMSYDHVGHVVGAARIVIPTERGHAALARDLEGAAQRLIVDGLLVAADASIRTVAVSTDGRRVAYAQTADGSAYATDPADWVVRVYYPDPQTTQEVGSGFAPFFIDDSTLGYFTAAGIFAVDLETGTPRALLREVMARPHDTTLVSPDRAHIAWQDADGRLSLYTLETTGARSLGSFSFADVPGASSVALGNTAFYAIRPTNNGSEVWRQNFTGALTRAAVLPPSLETTALVFLPN